MTNPNTALASFQNADAYEQIMGRWSRRLAPLLIRFGGLLDGDRVLDVGCETGSLAPVHHGRGTAGAVRRQLDRDRPGDPVGSSAARLHRQPA